MNVKVLKMIQVTVGTSLCDETKGDKDQLKMLF